MYATLLLIHSVLRWVLLILVIIALVRSIPGWSRNRLYQPIDNKLSLFALILAHTQALTGIVLYIVSPIVQAGLRDMGAAMKQAEIRFWVVEHIAGMIVAVALLTIGRVASKKKSSDRAKHKTIVVYFVLALILMLYLIPWERV